MEYFVDLDVSRQSCALCIVGGYRKVCMERESRCDFDGNANCLNAFGYPIVRIDFEAGALS